MRRLAMAAFVALAACAPWTKYSRVSYPELMARAESAIAAKHYHEAHEYLDAALHNAARLGSSGEDDELLHIHQQRARVFSGSGEIEEGETFLERVALMRFPHDPILVEYHASFLWKLGHRLEAEHAAEEALSADPQRCTAWTILALRWCEDVETCDLPPRSCRDQASAWFQRLREAR